MAKFGAGTFILLLVDGHNLISSLTEQVTLGMESITQQTNPFGASGEEHTPVTLEKGALTSGGGFYDETTDALHSALASLSTAMRVMVAGIEGNTIGATFWGFAGAFDLKYMVQDQRDGLTKADASYIVSGLVEIGTIVQHLTAYTADWDTKTGGAGATDAPVDYTLDELNRRITITSNTLANPTVVTSQKPHGLTTGDKIFVSGSNSTPTIDGERTVTVTGLSTFTIPVNVSVAGTAGTFIKANTNAGGSGYLQVTAYAGFTNVVVKIMHSPDDITYAALITFTTVTAIGAERKTVTGTVDRYLSSNGVKTGAGSITPFLGFKRN